MQVRLEMLLKISGEESRAHVTRERESSVPDRHKLKSSNGRVSNSKRVQNVQVHSPNMLTCISSHTPHPTSPFRGPPTPSRHPLTFHLKLQQQILLCRVCTVLKLIRWFSVCTSNLIIDQQPNVDMFQQPRFYSKQNGSPSQTQLLQKYIAHLSF